jgi:hypothetical protein
LIDEHPAVTGQKICEKAARYGEDISWDHPHASPSNQQPHHDQVSDQRDQSVGQMKAHQAYQPALACTVPPGEVLVPEKIMQDRSFYGQRRRR